MVATNNISFFWYHWFYSCEVICIHLHYCRFFHLYCTFWNLVLNKYYPCLGYKPFGVIPYVTEKSITCFVYECILLTCIFLNVLQLVGSLCLPPLYSFKSQKPWFWTLGALQNHQTDYLAWGGGWALGMVFQKAAQSDLMCSQSWEALQKTFTISSLAACGTNI